MLLICSLTAPRIPEFILTVTTMTDGLCMYSAIFAGVYATAFAAELQSVTQRPAIGHIHDDVTTGAPSGLLVIQYASIQHCQQS